MSEASVPLTAPGRSLRRAFLGRSDRVALWVGVAIVAVYALAAILAPWITTGRPNDQSLLAALQPPGSAHWLGTDPLGRDVFTRVVYAARVDLVLGVVLSVGPMLFGMLVGLVSGFFGRWVDVLLMRTVDVVIALPFLVLVIAIVAVVGPGLTGVYVALAAVVWTIFARLTRAEMLVLREQPFMLAARGLGYSGTRILLRHALPNVLRPNLVLAASVVVLNIGIVASLSYLGIGVVPPQAEWGAMISDGQSYISTDWWVSTMPGLAVVLAGIGFVLVADGFAEQLERRRRMLS